MLAQVRIEYSYNVSKKDKNCHLFTERNTKLVYHTKASISGEVLLHTPLQKISYLSVSLNIYLIFFNIEGEAQPAIMGDVLHLNIKLHFFLPADIAIVNNGIFCMLQSESLWAMKQPNKQSHLYEKVKI